MEEGTPRWFRLEITWLPLLGRMMGILSPRGHSSEPMWVGSFGLSGGMGRVFREGGSDDELPRNCSKKVKYELKEDRSSYERWLGRGAWEAKIFPHSQLTPVW